MAVVVRLPREDLHRDMDQAVEATVTTAAATITAVAAVAEEGGDETDPDLESVTATDTEEEEDGGAAPTGGRETGPRAIGIVAEEVVGEIVGRAFLDLYGQKVGEHSVRV